MTNSFNEVSGNELKTINGGFLFNWRLPSAIEQFEAIAHCFDPNSPKHQILYSNYQREMSKQLNKDSYSCEINSPNKFDKVMWVAP